MLGYGRFHYRYASGREGDAFTSDIHLDTLRELLADAGRSGYPTAVT